MRIDRKDDKGPQNVAREAQRFASEKSLAGIGDHQREARREPATRTTHGRSKGATEGFGCSAAPRACKVIGTAKTEAKER
jgi:hypothetical protein